VTSREGATMVAHEKRIRFGCMLAASLLVFVLTGCSDVSESGSSHTAQHSNYPERGQRKANFDLVLVAQ
jgi:hypothetical protein